jgi:cytochrome P450
VPLVEFDFMPFGAKNDPYPTYAAMREAGRVLRSPFGALMVHRYDDVREVHGDHEHFSMGAIGGAMPMMEVASREDGFMAQTMLTTDPPDHERLRRVVQQAFTPRSIAQIEERVRAITRRLLGNKTRGETFDIVAEYAGPLPTIVIAELLGVPPEDATQFRLWSDSITGGGTDAMMQMGRNSEGALAMRRYLLAQIAKRETEPTDDLIGRMVVANRDGSMTNEEVAAACVLLLIAGNETTMRLITNMTLALGRFPDQQARVAEDRSLVAAAVEETLRYDSPVQMLFRATKSPVTVGDVELGAGNFVLTMLAAANRDPDAFPNPDAFDIQRTGNPHISFGHGIHFCLGAQLARMEARVAFEELFELMPRVDVVTPDDELEYPTVAMLRSPKSLAVRAAG